MSRTNAGDRHGGRPAGTESRGSCVFCGIVKRAEVLLENEWACAFPDKYPVSEGHTLIVPKRHVADYFEISEKELTAIHELLRARRRQLLEEDRKILGFNIGVNSGEAAGQTIWHCHIHLIPRRAGDTERPRGGVRGVIPCKMDYPC
ncbi:MAG TPA: HIT family protein [Syntrophales bacterium]|nr:HIT family protein [Syntrophales bacterium]